MSYNLLLCSQLQLITSLTFSDKLQSILQFGINSKKAPGSHCAALLLHYLLISLDTRAAA